MERMSQKGVESEAMSHRAESEESREKEEVPHEALVEEEEETSNA